MIWICRRGWLVFGTVAVMGDTMACDPLSTHWVTENFRRVRFGIGRPAGKRDVVGYVLGQWSKAEAKLAQSVMDLVLVELVGFLETSQFENTSFSAPELA
ncbi:MAG: hypothetical protein Ct9H300mP21_02380 [Pseudomonadota bacterium]|nr:MAG: hypothetical protein Ct9H300mP21_02380 [Pseudomonadota bacterium]